VRKLRRAISSSQGEAGPETEVTKLACLVCGGPLAPRDGKFVLKYFLLREGRRKCGVTTRGILPATQLVL
jgi:prepilin signal peptidase PulO-like enzyme (type II secretory pathway)